MKKATKRPLPFLLIGMVSIVAALIVGCGKKETASEVPDTNKEFEQEASEKTQVNKDALVPDSPDLENGIKATIEIKDYGTISLILDPSQAPITVDNFVKLANEGFYDGLTFHRIIEGFMMQGGDPNGTGTGGSGQNIKGEFAQNGVNNNISHKRGVISMARSGNPDSASSQFFIVHEDSEFLDGQYAAFGYVTDGMDIVDSVCKDAKPIDNNGTIPPEDQPVIIGIKIENGDGSAGTGRAGTGDPALAKEAMESFQAFIDGDIKAEYKNGSSENIYQTKDRIETMNQEDFSVEAGEILDVTYAFIDCGNDGVKELAVSYNADITYSGSNVYIYSWDGGAKTIKELYHYEYAYRVYGTLYECGVVEIGGSSSYSSGGSDFTAVLPNGDAELLYSMNYEFNPQYWVDMADYASGTSVDEKAAVGQKLVDAGGEELEVQLLEYIFESYDTENFDPDTYYNIPRFYSATSQNMSTVEDAFKSAGVRLCTQDEINEMTEERLRAYGLSTSMLKEPQWNTL